jgi:predicted phosphodiesterase
MRIALISDIHGNTIALDAVLADAAAMGAEQYWFIGDFSVLGPEPAAVVDRVASLPGARYVRGNTDRYMVAGDAPPPTLDAVRSDSALISTYAEIAASLAWTQGYLTASGWLGWFERLPLELRLSTPAAVRVLAVHAAPGTDDGAGVHPGRSNAELSSLLEGAEADLVVVGHTHEPMVRRVGSQVVVNLGSVSNPKPPDLRASYGLLEVTNHGVEFAHRRVAYDRVAFADAVRRSRHPSAEFILGFQRGHRPAAAPHPDHVPFETGRRLSLPLARDAP